VLAPFGRRKLVGILLAVKGHSELADTQLKAADSILDENPILDDELMQLGQWSAEYYQYPIGEAFSAMLPALLRKGEAMLSPSITHWRLTTDGKGLPEDGLKRAPKQAEILSHLQQHGSINRSDLKTMDLSNSALKQLEQKALIEPFEQPVDSLSEKTDSEKPLSLNKEQHTAVDSIQRFDEYSCLLLDGVTGSGKTEVYLQIIDKCLAADKQILVLVPEIGLTPQTLKRFERRFRQAVVAMHSGLNDKERLLAWQHAKLGKAKIIIGTRSAIFTPMEKLGLIIIDEEHDASFKQQDGFRYSARDLAVKRGHDIGCPVVLGSATPSLESLHNARSKRFNHLKLTERATGATKPHFDVVDIRHAPLYEGYSQQTLATISETLNRQEQVLVFINRRGFAPMLLCHSCGWIAQCQHCDANLTVHFQQRLLRCHHCEFTQPMPGHCGHCHSNELDFKGPGTERSEIALATHFKDTNIIRVDRDTTSRKHAMSDMLAEIANGEPCILVGTQMLAKGHHFPNVTLVVILDADSGLFSTDFRSSERFGQLLTQVAGRAGREEKPGTVLIQTHHPEHPLLATLIHESYNSYAANLLAQRQQAALPPFRFGVMIRSEAKNINTAEELLREIRQQYQPENKSVTFLGPLPAPMTKKAGHYRAQLWLQASSRRSLQQLLTRIAIFAENSPLGKRTRWSIDVDPIDMF